MTYTHSYHLVDSKGGYQGARQLTDEAASKLEESGFHLIPVGDAHLSLQTINEIVREQHTHR